MNWWRTSWRKARTGMGGVLRSRAVKDDRGMSTVEYAIGTLAAAAFATVLLKILTGDAVAARMNELITHALSGSF